MNKYKEQRPWGEFERFCLNEKVTVKILSINCDAILSLQYHHERDEFWRIISGKVGVVLGEKNILAGIGDEFFIPRKTKHCVRALDSSAQVLEISFGNFDEKDIVRLEDKYKRLG